MRDAQFEIEGAGARLAIVGNGEPHHARDFAQQTGFSGAVYTDPERQLYKALGMKRSLGSTVSGQALKNAWRAWSTGHRQTMTKGDPWQQGGTLVVSGTGQLLFGHVSDAGGDHASTASILEALRTS